jgi:hypothetical protein
MSFAIADIITLIIDEIEKIKGSELLPLDKHEKLLRIADNTLQWVVLYPVLADLFDEDAKKNIRALKNQTHMDMNKIYEGSFGSTIRCLESVKDPL